MYSSNTNNYEYNAVKPVEQTLSNDNVNYPVSGVPDSATTEAPANNTGYYSNYYDMQTTQYPYYTANDFYTNQANYFAYYNSPATPNYYSGGYTTNQFVQPSVNNAEFNQNYQNYSYTNVAKSTTPPPPVGNYSTEAKTHSELTPEKTMNDSGIDLISPQLQMTKLPLQQLANTENAKVDTTQLNKVDNTNDESVDEYDEEDDESAENSKENCDKSSSKSSSPAKPPKPYLEIIADAILSTNVKMMQLHEIYHLMEKKFEYFAKNVNKSWRNSVRHNLSLNECFVKAGRGSNGKGNYWKIHPLCEKEFIRGNFRRKSFKQLIRAGSANRANQNSAAPSMVYPVSMDYALNYRTMPSVLPAQATQAFNANPTSSNFNYSFLNQYPAGSAQSYENSKNHRYQPY